MKYKSAKMEWQKQYFKTKTQTCDFSAYIITTKHYKQGVLIEVARYISVCDECEKKSCRTWKYYSDTGKLMRTINYGKCNLSTFDKAQ